MTDKKANSISILIVDDHQENIDLIEAALIDENYEIYSANCGKKAIELINQMLPDIVLLDIMMDDIDGFEVCKIVKSDPKTAKTLIVMITASNEPEYKLTGLKAGTNDFLNKPVDINLLCARLRNLSKISISIKENSIESNDSIAEEVFFSSIANSQIALLDTDNSEITHLYEKLSSEFIQVYYSSNYSEGLEEISKKQYDAIIIAFYSESCNHIRIISSIKANPINKESSIIALINESDKSKIADYLDIGANDCILSPVEPNELIAKCKTCIQYSKYVRKLSENQKKITSGAKYDGLTTLLTRKHFDIELSLAIQNAINDKKNIILALIDIDFFKKINDSFGHLAGDQVLSDVSHIIKSNLTKEEIIGRYGGEEIAVVFSNCIIDSAHASIENIRKTIERTYIEHSGEQIKVTISAGIAELKGEDLLKEVGGEQPDKSAYFLIISKADDALYTAKKTGRNKIVINKE